MLLFDEPRRTQGTTFAEPDDGKSFTRRTMEAIDASLAGSDAFKAADLAFKDLATAGGAIAREPAGLARGLADGTGGRIARAAWDQQAYVETSTGRQAAEEESYDRLIAAVKASSGVAMQNPLRGGYRDMAELDLKAEFGSAYRRRTEVDPRLFINAGVGVFKRQLGEYMDSNPAVADAVQTAMIDFAPGMIAARADQDMREASNASDSLLLTLGASLVGGIVPAMRDPINAAGLALAAGPSLARTVAGRLFDVAVREALINGGITAAQQPFVQDWRRVAGLEAGFGEAAQNVAMGAAFGALFGAGAQGLRELFPRAAVGEASVADVRQALGKAGVKLDDESAAVLRFAEAADRADDAALVGRPGGMADDEAKKVLRQAVRRAEDLNEPLPELPVNVARTDAARARVTDEALPMEIGKVDQVDGKPVRFERFDPAEIGTDAAAMQYKGGGNEDGVTDRLRSVTRWNPLAGGRVFVLERADGTQVIADGHQRLGLARRIQAEDASQQVELIGHLFREADGWTTADVRALAAKKNMQEGSGTPLDAARILRDRPDLADGALPKGGSVVRDGMFLARLSEDAFRMVNAGVVPEHLGARVGALAPDPATHVGILNDMLRFPPGSVREADLLIGEAMRAGFVVERQTDMFGTMEATVSLMGERVRVLSETIRLLGSDKRMFAGLERNAATIEAAGNQLARDSNEALAARAAGLQDMIVKLAQRMGPVSDALTEQARALKDGAKPLDAARAFAARVDDLIQRDGLPALLQEPALRPAGPVAEPGTPQALAAAERIEVDPFTMDMFGASPSAKLSGWKDAQPHGSVADLYVVAERWQSDLVTAGKDIAKAYGAAFKNPGIKDRATAEEKISRKGYEDARSLTDIVRASIIIPDEAARVDVVKAMQARFDLIDEGVNVTVMGGYTDQKLIVRFADGTLGEMQIVTKAMQDAKSSGGHDLYKRARALPPGSPERLDLEAKMEALYSAASRDAKATAGSAGSDGNRLANSSAETARPLSDTSSGSNEVQAPLMTAQASVGDSNAGRPSKSMKTGDDVAMGADAQTSSTMSSEKTAAGEQTLIPGVAVVTEKQVMELKAGKPLQGGDAAPPAGGLFDDAARQQVDLMDALPLASRDDPTGTRLVSQADALAEADQLGFSADLVKACKT